MIKKLFLTAGMLLFALSTNTLLAQNDEVGKDKQARKFSQSALEKGARLSGDSAWTVGANLGVNLNQAAYSNWQAGGVNSLAINNILEVYANYSDGQKWDWTNRLSMAFGVAFQDSLFSKTDDRIELSSRVDRLLSENWSASGFLNFRTQFVSGFDTPGQNEDSLRISSFMAPGYLVNGVGFTYKPNEKFALVLSPATSKMTFVLDDFLSQKGVFGVDPGDNMRFEIGGYINLLFNTPLGDNISLKSRMDIYANYVDIDYTIPDINAEVILFMKINEYINANITVNSIYDNDVKFDTDNNPDTPGEDRLQIKEVLSVGFSYNFGDS